MGAIEPCGAQAAIRAYTHQQEMADKAEAFYAGQRKRFIDGRVDELMADPGEFLILLRAVMECEAEAMVAVTLCAAIKEGGFNWDGISAFGDLIHNEARSRAVREWDRRSMCYESDREADKADFEVTA